MSDGEDQDKDKAGLLGKLRAIAGGKRDEGKATPPPRPMGRPPKISQELIEKICLAVRAGNYIETAAAYAGVNKSTLYDWLKRGARARGGGIYKDFSNAVEQAMATAEVHMVAKIAKAAERNWGAAAWHLERTRPARFGKQERMELTGADGGPVRHALEGGALLKKLVKMEQAAQPQAKDPAQATADRLADYTAASQEQQDPE